MARLLSLLFLVPALAGAVTFSDLADVHWDGHRVVAKPGHGQGAVEQTIEVVQSEECPYRALSAGVLEIPGSCQYLGGIYRYAYRTASQSEHRVAVGFSLARSAGGHVFVVSMPLDMPVVSVSR